MKDNAGIPIVGATIMEKGSTNGTVSDLDGNFSLQMNSQGTILISYIGYITQEIKVDKNDKLIITLEEDTETLDEVVVVGYGAIQKRSVSTAISTVKGGNLRDADIKYITKPCGYVVRYHLTTNQWRAGSRSGNPGPRSRLHQ